MRRFFLIVLMPAFLALLWGENVDPQQIIQKFAGKESEFRELWQKYTYTQKVDFQVLSRSGAVRERQVMEIEIYFTTDGKRQTRILSDRGKLQSVQVSKEDISDAVGLQPFVLTTEELPQYNITYEGEEEVDELSTYVFNVQPKKIEKKKRYFSGRVWVDQKDLQIVMSKGRAVPDYRNNKFPEFETRREQVDGNHWFPTWTKAEDTLVFESGNDVHVRQFITYENFKKFEVGATIKYGKVEEKPDQKPEQQPDQKPEQKPEQPPE